MEGFEARLEVLVGDAEDRQLVAKLLVARKEELFERLAFAFAGAGGVVLGEGDLGGFIVVIPGRELDRLCALSEACL